MNIRDNKLISIHKKEEYKKKKKTIEGQVTLRNLERGFSPNSSISPFKSLDTPLPLFLLFLKRVLEEIALEHGLS